MEYSVVIPARNRPDMVARAVRSAYGQSIPPREVIVVDDGSQPPLELPPDLGGGRTRLIRHGRVAGAAAARNTGMQAATTAIVAFLDGEAEWLPSKMEVQLAWLRGRPDSVLVTCGYLHCEAGRQYEEVFTRAFVERCRHYDNFFGSFSCIVVRRLPGMYLDPGLPALEDWDFATRSTRAASFGVIGRPLVKYHAPGAARLAGGAAGHLRALRRYYRRHRGSVSPDARRWLLARIIFERSHSVASRRMRLRRVAFSIALAAVCRVPLLMKLRAIGRRAASLGASPRAIAAVRAISLAGLQGLRGLTVGGAPVPWQAG